MDAKASIQKIVKKPPLLVIIPIIYFFLILFSKWKFALPIDALYFFLGGLLGVYLIDIAEEFFKLQPSPFRTTLFVLALTVIGFYTISSTREAMAAGVVLGLLMTIFLFQVSEWRIRKNLDSWYQMYMWHISGTGQKIGLFLLGMVLLFETIMFITN